MRNEDNSRVLPADESRRLPTSRRRCGLWFVVVTSGLIILACTPLLLASGHRAIRHLRAWSIGATLLDDGGVVLQRGRADCGHACLMNALLRLGREVPPSVVETAMHARIGVTVAELVSLASTAGLTPTIHRVPTTCIRRALDVASLPAVALVGPHYLLLEERPLAGFMTIIDPALGRLRVPVSMLERQWRNVLVTFDADATPESVCEPRTAVRLTTSTDCTQRAA